MKDGWYLKMQPKFEGDGKGIREKCRHEKDKGKGEHSVEFQ
jgi:hypothetical protein